MSPKIFLSHASEDKDRFVLKFAEKLRNDGIDAWLDKWEMYPGDSLVDKIFKEGLKNADAVIIIISKNSINKRWVREELNVSMVKKINQGTKLIPVVIDGCEVPECLSSTIWVKINDLNDYQTEYDRIVMTIYNHKEKPPLGLPPKFTKTVIDILPNLNNVDSLVMNISCKKAIEKGEMSICIDDISNEISGMNIPESEFLDSLEVLNRKGYIQVSRIIGGSILHFKIEDYGFDEFVRVSIKNFDELLKKIVSNIINSEMKNSNEYAFRLKLPLVLVNHVFTILEKNKLIKVVKILGDGMNIFQISPELKRIVN